MKKDDIETPLSYTDSMLDKLEQDIIPWDNADNSDEVLEDTPLILGLATKKINNQNYYQVYLKTSLKNNNTLRIPIPNQTDKMDALVEAYNLLGEMLDTIGEEFEKEEE